MSDDTVIEFPRTSPETASEAPTQTAPGVTGRPQGVEREGLGAAVTPSPGSYGRVVMRRRDSTAPAPIPIDSLYPAVGGATSEILRALELLADAIRLLGSAREQAESDPAAADRCLQRAQLLLPQLFTCRRIGDGFGATVNSVQVAFVNLRGKLLSRAQITAVWRAFRELRQRPFISFENAVQLITDMEESGLPVDPDALALLLDDPDA